MAKRLPVWAIAPCACFSLGEYCFQAVSKLVYHIVVFTGGKFARIENVAVQIDAVSPPLEKVGPYGLNQLPLINKSDGSLFFIRASSSALVVACIQPISGVEFQPGTWYLVPGTWCLVPGAWYLVPYDWCLMPGAWHQMYLVLSAWCQMSGAWHLVPGAWYLVPGTWCLMPGA